MRWLAITLLLVSSTVAADPGEDLFVDGLGAPALLSNGMVRVEEGRFSCAGCHGLDGEGGGEGATRAPPVTWEDLSKPTAQRPAYTAKSFFRAVTEGIAPDGKMLGQAMPRYDLDGELGAELVRFLKGLRERQAIGVGPSTIRMGRAESDDFSDGFAQAIRIFNAEGGAFGRHVELVDEGLSMLPIGDLGKVVRTNLAREALDLLIARIKSDGHVQVELQPEENSTRLAYLLNREGLSVAHDAKVLLLTRPLSTISPPNKTIYAPLDLIGEQLSELARSEKRLVLVVPNRDLAKLAITQRRGRDFIDGLIAGEMTARALLMAGRDLTRTQLLSAFDEVDMSEFIEIMQ